MFLCRRKKDLFNVFINYGTTNIQKVFDIFKLLETKKKIKIKLKYAVKNYN